jgi:predicted short-subunit dehydrogenase-like oxidoreductase (DUF2520 family)
MQTTLGFVGAGRVGRALGRQLRELRWKIGAVVTRSEPSARGAVRFIGEGTPLAVLSRRILASSVIVIATPDGAIEQVSAELARIGAEELQDHIVLHTSGALDSSILHAVRSCGAAAGSMHPLQTFSGVAVPPLEGKVFAIEGDAAAVKMARKIARALGGAPMNMEPRKKPLYHAAGTFAAGQTLVVVEAAVQLMMSLGMKRTEASRALVAMTRQVLQNYERFGPRSAWTGPLSRGDYEVVAKHLQALQDYAPEYKAAYEALNHLAETILTKDSVAIADVASTTPKSTTTKVLSIGGKG